MPRYLLDQDRRREWKRQTALMKRIENQFAARLSTEIYDASEEMVERWLLTSEVLPARGFREKLEASYREMITAATVSFGMRIWQQGKAHGLVFEKKQDFAEIMTSLALRYVAGEIIRQRITGVENTTRANIVDAIARGYSEGLGQRGIADLILDRIPSIAQFRANMIARTEVHGAANYGSLEAAKQTGVTTKKEWLSAADERTRSFDAGDEWDHASFDGTTVGNDEAFAFTSAKGQSDSLMYPGDPSGAAGNVINCRCTQAFALDLEGLLGQQDNQETVPNTIPLIERFMVEKGIATSPALTGLNVSALKQAANVALDAVRRFNLSPLTGFGPSSRYGIKSPANLQAAIIHGKVKGAPFAMFHAPTKFGQAAEYKRIHASAVKMAPAYFAQAQDDLKRLGAAANRDVLERIKRLSPNDYGWTFSDLLSEGQNIKGVVNHEYGHVVHLLDKKIGPEINSFLTKEKPRSSGWQYLVSKYAGQDDSEYVAETFSIYMHGDKSQFYRIHPELLKIYQKADNKA